MRRFQEIFLGFIFTGILTFPSYATEPRPIPPSLMPPAVTPSGPANLFQPRPLIADPLGPMTLERLNKAGLSSSWYYALHRTIAHGLVNPTSITLASEPKEATTARLHVRETAALAAGVKATNDTLQDAESAVTALNIGGTTYTVAASNHYTNVNGTVYGHINAVSSSNFSNFTLPTQLPIPVDRRGSPQFQDSSDPMLAANVYAGGVAPGRIYCSGILFTPDARFNPSMVGLWHSDDGGVTWSQPTVVATQSGGGYLVDKPAVTVSSYPSTLGYVYVSYVVVNTSNSLTSSVWVARSTDGGLNFETPAANITYDFVQGPVVAVNANDGTVYCTWVNERFRDIRFASSSGSGALSFGPHAIVDGTNILPIDTQLTGGVRAATLPMMKFNWHDNRLGVVWHAGVGGVGTSNTEAYYSYLPCVSNCNAYGWRTPVQINDSSTNDQFQPALDYINGDVVIGFYDRRRTDNVNYEQWFGYVHSDGTTIQSNFDAQTAASNPTFHTATTGDANFIGDYHDEWTWTYPEGTRAVNSWIFIQDPTIIGDIYLSKVQP
jgi:hypothetical protein